jgi:hypothetical protein
MDHVGMDVHKNATQLCAISENEAVHERRIRMEAGRFLEVMGRRPSSRILIEASTESEWVARCLEGMSHGRDTVPGTASPLSTTN